jgi:ubiquinone/menaquinone biosynthesis C-methylase UbiE
MSSSAPQPSRDYVLTHTDAERRRLALQASILNPFTDRFLRDAGIADGMRVLDFGCGVGDVSLIAGRLVGAAGSVTGIDVDPEALATGAERAKQEELNHVRFIHADVGEFETDTKFDAVVGRLFLIHTREPVAFIRRAQTFVRPGGIVAFQDFDLSFVSSRYTDLPMWETCGKATAALFERAGLPAGAGSLLYTWFLEAGLPVPEYRLECLVDGGEDSLYYEWLAKTVRSLMPKMLALKVLEPDTLDIDRLEQALREETLRAKRPCVGPAMGGAFVRTPVQ